MRKPAPVPESGDDWLWYKPAEYPPREPYARRFHCKNCEVYWEEKIKDKPIHCFCCGRFMRTK